MEDVTNIFPDDIEIIDTTEYCTDITEHFANVPEIATSLIRDAKRSFKEIEHLLYSAPAFINAIKAIIPEETYQVILSGEQKAQIASGALKLMTKKDGSLMANLVNPETKKIVSTISLEKGKLSPELSQVMASYITQMQMVQIAEQIQMVQVAIEEIRQGQEYDRLATAYSCQQKLLQAMAIKNPQLKSMALLRIVSDAEDSRNLLMQSQNANVVFIRNQPESFWGKFKSGVSPKEINERMSEIRQSLCALNIVSLAEAMAYQEMGETEAAQLSLQYYAEYIKKTYLDAKGFVERLDMIDLLPEKYWLKTLLDIEQRIKALPCNVAPGRIGGKENGAEEM